MQTPYGVRCSRCCTFSCTRRICHFRASPQAIEDGAPTSDRWAATVTEIATSFCFGQPGRFSVEYRELFGESPSHTLQHAPPDRRLQAADRQKASFYTPGW